MSTRVILYIAAEERSENFILAVRLNNAHAYESVFLQILSRKVCHTAVGIVIFAVAVDFAFVSRAESNIQLTRQIFGMIVTVFILSRFEERTRSDTNGKRNFVFGIVGYDIIVRLFVHFGYESQTVFRQARARALFHREGIPFL